MVSLNRNVTLGKWRRWIGWFGPLFGILLLALYFAQHARLAPNSVDGGMMLDNIHRVSQGERLFFDFLDYYGPVTWWFPAIFYTAVGYQAWGVRLWMIVLKLISAILAYLLVKRLSCRFYAILAIIWFAVLFGAPWQFLQIAYPFHLAIPVFLEVSYLFLFDALRRPATSVLLAASLTVALLWAKVVSGLLLFAGGMFYLMYWFPAAEGSGKTITYISRYCHGWFRRFQTLGLIVYGVVFLSYISEYFNLMYFFYLAGPLLFLLIYTQRQLRDATNRRQPSVYNLLYSLLYLAATAVGWVIFLLAYFGWPEAFTYLEEQVAIISRLDYASPFLALGAEGDFVGLNESYWLQLPWLTNATVGLWIWLRRKSSNQRFLEKNPKTIHAQVAGLWSLVVLYTFVIYSRSDEVHLFQAVIPTVPLLFILLYHVEKLSFGNDMGRRRLARALLVIGVCAAGTTIATVPEIDMFRWGEGDWRSERLRYLKFRAVDGGGTRRVEPELSDRRWDEGIMWASWMVDILTQDESEVLILSRTRLINYASKTRPVGGRNNFLFYLLKNSLIDRQEFDSLAPPGYIDKLVKHPPQVVVSTFGETPILVKKIPELKSIVERRYRLVGEFIHIRVYLRNDIPLVLPE